MISATSLQNGGPMITKLSMLLGRRPSSGKCFQVRTSERRPGMTLGGNVVDVSSRGGDTLMSYVGGERRRWEYGDTTELANQPARHARPASNEAHPRNAAPPHPRLLLFAHGGKEGSGAPARHPARGRTC